MKNFFVRLLTGIIYATFLCLGVMWNSYSFLVLFSIVIILCLWEFYSLVSIKKEIKIKPYYYCFGGLLLFMATFLYASGVSGHYIFSLYLFYIVTLLVLELYEKRPDPIGHIAYLVLGQCYIALPISVLNFIAFRSVSGELPVYNSLLILSLLVFIWANDTGAYLIGVLFGKHKLFERISPKKSWEGFFGGLAFTIIAAFALAHFFLEIPYYHWIGLSLGVVVFGTWGDLFESLLKRTLDVKDSGHSLPGHGGYLDRFDSLLMAIYAVLFYMQLFII